MSEEEEVHSISILTALDDFINFTKDLYSEDESSNVVKRVKRFESHLREKRKGELKDVEKYFGKMVIEVYRQYETILKRISNDDEGMKTLIDSIEKKSVSIHTPNDVKVGIPLSFISRKCINLVKEAHHKESEENERENLIETFLLYLLRLFGTVCSEELDEKISETIEYLEDVLNIQPGENPNILGFVSSVLDKVSGELGDLDIGKKIKSVIRGGISKKDRQMIEENIDKLLDMNRSNGNVIKQMVEKFSSTMSDEKSDMYNILNDPKTLQEFIADPTNEKFKDLEGESENLKKLFMETKNEEKKQKKENKI